jgi:hypothetical protein
MDRWFEKNIPVHPSVNFMPRVTVGQTTFNDFLIFKPVTFCNQLVTNRHRLKVLRKEVAICPHPLH